MIFFVPQILSIISFVIFLKFPVPHIPSLLILAIAFVDPSIISFAEYYVTNFFGRKEK